MKKTIFVSTSFKGLHSYESLKEKLKQNPLDSLKKVEFLENKHRHRFNVKVWFEVSHNDRDLEFFLMQEEVENALKYKYCSKFGLLEVGSCEMIAQDLLEYFSPEYSIYKITVDEDGENGVEFIA